MLLNLLSGKALTHHTREVIVYRPKGYNFPASRGRSGFNFREGGKLIYFGIGCADGSEQFFGDWVIEGVNRIKINLNSDRVRPFVLNIIFCDNDMLKMQRYTE